MQGVLAIDVVTAALAIVSLLLIAVPQPPRRLEAQANSPAASFWSEMRAGLRYTWSWPGLMVILVMATLINFFLNAASALMPILVTKHFGGAAMHLASLESVFGVGAIVGGIGLGMWGGFRRRILTSLMGLVGIGLGFLLLGLTPANMFWMALAAAFLAAVMVPLTNGPLMAILQVAVAPEMQGRVFTLIGSVATAISPLGLVLAGPVADLLGVQAWYIAGGVVCMGMGTLSLFIPSVMRMEDHRTVVLAEAAQVPVATL
jgi:DHA3 family macrolide efflux protein-like MFS transporter